ncbi:MAG: hypothetical protein K0Q94_1987 [Paenibacillus sp.]|nr:hypothetical protein [Paenibacillus sp.]
MQLYCEQCNRKAVHQEVVEPYERKSGFDEDIQWFEEYYIAKCRRCDRITFVKRYGEEETWADNACGDRVYTYTYTLYREATVDKQRRKKKYFEHIPDSIQELYGDVIDTYNNRNLLILCPVGLRMVIEAICKEKRFDFELLFLANGVPVLDDEGQQMYRFLTLSEMIKKLHDSGYITLIQAEVLQLINEMGNDADYEITKDDDEMVGAVIEVLESMLYSIYVAPMKLTQKRKALMRLPDN